MNSFATDKAFEVYITTLALKRHFTSDYDFFKYNGKVRANRQSFEKRNDGYFYFKLSKRKDWFDYLLANMLHDPKVWIGRLVNSEECQQIYNDFVKKTESLTYIFKSDLKKLDPNFNKNLMVIDGEYPHLLNLHRSGQVSMETVVILDDLVNFSPHWNRKISDTLIYPSINRTWQKYKPFLRQAYDKDAMKKLVLSTFEQSEKS